MKMMELSAVMFATGVGIPIMAAMNAQLGAKIGPQMAGAVLFVVAFLPAAIAAALTPRPAASAFATTPVWLYAGGLFVAFYVLTVTVIAPKIGVAAAVLFVLLGQMVSTAAIEHYALFGAIRRPIDLTRVVGLVVMAVGVFLVLRPAAPD